MHIQANEWSDNHYEAENPHECGVMRVDNQSDALTSTVVHDRPAQTASATSSGIGASTGCARELDRPSLEAPGAPKDCQKHVLATDWCLGNGEGGQRDYNLVDTRGDDAQNASEGAADRDCVYPTLRQYRDWGYSPKETCL